MGQRFRRSLWAVLLALVPTGCLRWQPPPPPPAGAFFSPVVDARLSIARDLSARAGDRPALEAAMDAYREVLAADAGSYAALTALAHQSILLGAAYTPEPHQQAARYREALAYCEQAMLTNPAFRAQSAIGTPPWEACGALAAREMDAMLFWCTAVLYLFKDTMGYPAQVANIRWIQRLGPFLDRMEAIDRGWGGGAVAFTRSLQRGILPGALGGDAAASRAALEEAVALGDGWLLPRWGRAKYFHVRDRDREGFRRDLAWVAAQDPAALEGPYAWNVYFQRDARQMLDEMDRILPP